MPLVLHHMGYSRWDHLEITSCQPRYGFLAATRAILKLKENALVTIGLPCSSYVFLNAGTSQRSADNPFGETSLEYIQAANKHPGNIKTLSPSSRIKCHSGQAVFRELRLTARVCLLILLMVVRGTYFFVEQPSSSLLEQVPYFKHMMTMVGKVMPMYRSFLPGAYH